VAVAVAVVERERGFPGSGFRACIVPENLYQQG
jgi:hypothetical protein